ncbi:MAG: DUF5800 family protein [Halobacteriaceae archaeon]
MTTLAFDAEGVDVVFDGVEFRLEADLVASALQTEYRDATDHQVLQIIEPNPSLSGEPRRIGDILDG